MFIAAAAAILVTIAMALARAVMGPSVWDRLLAANMIGTKIVLLIAVLGFLTNRPEWGDIALAYAHHQFRGRYRGAQILPLPKPGRPFVRH